jgi:hypothetical protein
VVGAGRWSVGGGVTFNERKTLEDLLHVHDLPRNELGDGKPDDIDGLVDISDDASHLCTGQAVGFGAEAGGAGAVGQVSRSREAPPAPPRRRAQ